MVTRSDSTSPSGQTEPAGRTAPRRATNAIEAGRGRNRSSTDRWTDAAADASSPHREAENSIQRAKRRTKDTDAKLPPNEPQGAVRDANSRAAGREQESRQERQDASSIEDAPRRERLVPEHVRKRFVQVGKHYYFADGARAFSDRGGRLTTPSENTEVIRSLVAIAEARGWNQITVRGTVRFRKEAWFAARRAGLEVRGFRPNEFERAHLIRALAREEGKARTAVPALTQPPSATGMRRPDLIPERASSGAEGKGRSDGRDRLLVGKLIDHGRATYHHDPHEPMSYFVKIETPRGDRTIWGVDLERAMKESLSGPQTGDEVGLRAVRQDAVKVRAHERDADGKIVSEKNLETHRNRWILEKRTFFESRAEAARTLRDTAVDPKQAVKRHPELVGTYLQMHAAELAAKQFRDPQDQQHFMAQVRSALAQAVARGEPLPPVRLRESAPDRAAVRSRLGSDRAPAPARE